MGHRLPGLRAVTALACFAAMAAGCAAGRSYLSAGSGDLQVKASLDGPASISQSDGTTAIAFDGGTLTVQKGRVELDGKELAKLPEGSKEVDVDWSGGKLTVRADGTSVLSTEIRR